MLSYKCLILFWSYLIIRNGAIKLSDNQDLIDSPVDNEKLDLRIIVRTDNYSG